jgi:hypothetical protein
MSELTGKKETKMEEFVVEIDDDVYAKLLVLAEKENLTVDEFASNILAKRLSDPKFLEQIEKEFQDQVDETTK